MTRFFRTIEADAVLRLALRSRLLRLIRLSDGRHTERLALLAQQACSGEAGANSLRTRADALLSAIYVWLPITTRHDVLEHWVDRGTKGALGRWLKAISSDETLFDVGAIFAYWRRTNDWRAAKTLAYRADASFLDDILFELANHCHQGWITSKAALRASTIPAKIWDVIRKKQPSSYAYLCAMTGRQVTEREALALIDEAPRGALEDGRGLVVWSIGQLGMVSVLDLVRADCDNSLE